MFAGVHKRLFGSGSRKTNTLGTTTMTCDFNGDSLLMCNERAKQEIRSLEADIEKQRSAAAEAAAVEAQKKSSADRDAEKENRWLIERLCTSEDENRWLMARLRMMRSVNRKLSGELRESKDENNRLRDSNANLEKREAERTMRFRIIEEKCVILSSLTTEVRTLIDLK